MANKYREGNYGYGHAKQELFELICEKFSSEREKFNHLMSNTDVDGQPQEWIDEEETLYPGLSVFLEQLHAEWAATDHDEPVEPGTYYPPQRQGMHQNVDSPSENET